MAYELANQSLVHGPAAWVSPGNLFLTKCRNSVPIPDQLDQNLHSNKIPSKCCIILALS